MNNYFITNKISKILELIIEFILSYIIVSPLVGTIFVFFDLHWGILAIIINTILSVLISKLLYEKHIFEFETLSEIVPFVILMVFCVVIYGKYSPVLALEQDPAAYIFKALNLVNYGYVYKPMPVCQQLIDAGIIPSLDGYATIQNGMQFKNGNMNVDFYSGAAFLYATIGFFYKKWIFYGQTLTMMLNATLLFFIIKKVFCKNSFLIKSSILYIMAFFISPIIVWFGRGSYTEPIAMTFALMMVYFLLFEKPEVNLLILILLSSHSARIDYILILFIGTFIITYFDYRKGFIFSILAIIVFYLFKTSYWIYSARIGMVDMKIFPYTPIIIVGMYIFSYFILKYQKENLIKLFYSKFILVLYCIFCFGLVMLMFRNSFTPVENYKVLSNGITSCIEFIFDLLFLCFPSIILIGGLLFLYNFLKNKKFYFHTSVFFLGVITAYFYLFINSGNSPALYWLLRRYYNVILPFATISFIFYVFINVTKKFNVIFGVILLMISANLYLDSKQTVDYDGLDKSVQPIVEEWKENNIKTVFYEKSLRKIISPILSYSSFEMIPISADQFNKIYNYYSENNLNKDEVLVLTQDNIENSQIYNINFTHLPMVSMQLPKQTINVENEFYASILSNMGVNNSDILYPSNSLNIDFGFNRTDSWTKDKFTLYLNNYKINKDSVVVEIEDILPQEVIDSVNLKLNIDSKILDSDYYEDKKFYFDVSEFKGKSISTMEFTLNTFNPKEKGYNGDSRDLGIPLLYIYLN